jgi:hypothetical protein
MLSDENRRKLQVINAGIDAMVQCTMLERFDPACICAGLRPLAFVRAELMQQDDGAGGPEWSISSLR